MIHRVLGWFGGFVLVKIRGKNVERFINLCKNNRLDLWQIAFCHNKKEECQLTFKIALRDFYLLRPISRKCKVRPLVLKRYGFPFLVGKMKHHKGFCMGTVLFFCILLFLSGRIWGICVEGESYHSQESILRYLEQIDVYGGMAAKKLSCHQIEEKLRHRYTDIGWASVERCGSKIYIRIKEVTLLQKQKNPKKGHLIAADNANVVSIVTRKGTAKVVAGKKVKKGEILISGTVPIYGDGDTLYGKEYVHADGDVVLETKEQYQDTLKKEYKKKTYTGHKKSVQEWQFGSKHFFCYNPLKYLETYKKYDIIREGGQLCPYISLRFPISYYKKTFREISYEKAIYSKKEAQKELLERYKRFIRQKKEKGYCLKKEKIAFYQTDSSFRCEGNLVFWRKEKTYRRIYKKNKIIYKEKEADGNNGNGNRDTGGA